MDDGFPAAVVEWTAFYAFTGGAAATIVGLLFVAVSLRLDLFRRKEVADVRDYASFTFGSLLAAMVVAGIALVPHDTHLTLAVPVVLLGLLGLGFGGLLVREWVRLNPANGNDAVTSARSRRVDLVAYGVTLLPFGGLVGVGGSLAAGYAAALPALAVVQGFLLGSTAWAAWALISHAGDGGG